MIKALWYSGLTFDGAGDMPGKTRGPAAHFWLKTENEKAVYFLCASHELNLCLSKVSNVPQILSMIHTMQFFGLFYKFSPKSQKKVVIIKFVKKILVSMSKSNIKPTCETNELKDIR